MCYLILPRTHTGRFQIQMLVMLPFSTGTIPVWQTRPLNITFRNFFYYYLFFSTTFQFCCWRVVYMYRTQQRMPYQKVSGLSEQNGDCLSDCGDEQQKWALNGRQNLIAKLYVSRTKLILCVCLLAGCGWGGGLAGQLQIIQVSAGSRPSVLTIGSFAVAVNREL